MSAVYLAMINVATLNLSDTVICVLHAGMWLCVVQHLGRGAWKPREKPKRHRGSSRQAKGSAGGATGSGRRGGGRAVRSDGGAGNSQQQHRKRGRGRQGKQQQL